MILKRKIKSIMYMRKTIPTRNLSTLRQFLKDKNIVLATGCFDILHVGHLYFLEQAAKQGDIFVVGINSDKSIKIIKGKSRPIVKQNERAQLISAFNCVDYVFIYNDISARDYILRLKPNVFVIGKDSVKEYPDECEAAKKIGAKLCAVKRIPLSSTTSILEKIKDIPS